MKCMQCDSTMKTARENFRYGESGLPVTLVGVKVSRCRKCGEYEVAIPKIEELHWTIAMALIRKRARLTSAEVRFLRKYLGWSGAEFARHMGVTPGAVSRWENSREQIGPVADRLLRLIVAHTRPAVEYSVDQLAYVVEKESTPVQLGLQVDEKGWHAQAA